MDKFAVPIAENPKRSRSQWKRSLVELNGKFQPNYRHDVTSLLIQSYSEVGVFRHSYHVHGIPCRTHVNWVTNLGHMFPFCTRLMGSTALDFDAKGIYMASATKPGCLTIHDFESLFYHADGLSRCPEEDEKKHLLHFASSESIDVVRWNPGDQNEVACASLKTNEISIFDLGYDTSEPMETLRRRATFTVHGPNVHEGLSDVAFFSHDSSRVFASDTCGQINVWDRRKSHLPQIGLKTSQVDGLTSIQLTRDSQVAYGAGTSGTIYTWDLRFGRSSHSFQSHTEAHYNPMTSVKLASLLNNIELLKEQSNIVPKEIRSIDINPSCPYQLGFHIDDGWSGVLDMHSNSVTHVHCPPPIWLDLDYAATHPTLIKPSWIPTTSIYAVGAYSCDGLYLLDFHPDPSSPCHVDFDESQKNSKHHQNRLLKLSEAVTAIAAHPLNGTIVAGTKSASLMMISQKRHSCQNGGKDC